MYYKCVFIDFYFCKINYNLKIMDQTSNLTEIVGKTLLGLDWIIKKEKPDVVLVHDDTAATIAGVQASFYNQTVIGHIEAGL